MKNLIIIGHPDKNSFCYNGIFKTVLSELQNKSEEIEIIDLYRCSFARPRDQLVESFKKLIIIFIMNPMIFYFSYILLLYSHIFQMRMAPIF